MTVPRSSPHHRSSADNGSWVYVGRTGHLRWFRIGLQHRKYIASPPPSSSCWRNCKMGASGGAGMSAWHKNHCPDVPFRCTGFCLLVPSVCLPFRLHFHWSGSTLPSTPFPSTLHFFYQDRRNLLFSMWRQTTHLRWQLLPTDLLA